MNTPVNFTAKTVVTFDGVEITVKDLIAKYTAYKPDWIRDALRAGDRSHAEFTKRWITNSARSKTLAGREGKATIMRYRQGLPK